MALLFIFAQTEAAMPASRPIEGYFQEVDEDEPDLSVLV